MKATVRGTQMNEESYSSPYIRHTNHAHLLTHSHAQVHKRKMLKKLREEKEAATPAKTKKSKGKKKKTPYSDLHNEQKKAKKSKKVKPASAETDEMSAGPNGMFKGKTIQEVSHPVESFTNLTRGH